MLVSVPLFFFFFFHSLLLLRSYSTCSFFSDLCLAVSETSCLSQLRRVRTFTLVVRRDDVSPACVPFRGS